MGWKDKPITKSQPAQATVHAGFSVNPSYATATLLIDDNTFYNAIGIGHLTFVINTPPSHLGWGAVLTVNCPGYDQFITRITVPLSDQELPSVTLNMAKPSFPVPPTRDQILNSTSSFQGLTIVTKQFGIIPWFEGTIASFIEEDRANIYAAKKLAGDRLCGLDISWNYAEPGQPYGGGNSIPPCDLTNNLERFTSLIREIIEAGFYLDLRLAGDGQSNGLGTYNDPVGWTYGYQWLMNNLAPIVNAVGEYIPYCIFTPGYDGVFYGWEPYQVKNFWSTLRGMLGSSGYIGIEYSIGVCHLGDGSATYNSPEGQCLDVIFQEFESNLHQDSFWQVAARMLGPKYVRPKDQPANDDPSPDWYLRKGTPRGPFVWNAFEWKTYDWVRGRTSLNNITLDRIYLANAGAYVCG